MAHLLPAAFFALLLALATCTSPAAGQQHQQHSLLPDPALRWDFDDDAQGTIAPGNTAYAFSTGDLALHGMLAGGATRTPASWQASDTTQERPGAVLTINNTAGSAGVYVPVPESATPAFLDTTDSRFCWVRMLTGDDDGMQQQQQQPLLVLANVESQESAALVALDGVLAYVHTDGFGAQSTIVADTAHADLRNGLWHHVGVTRTSTGAITLFVDGSPVGSDTLDATAAASPVAVQAISLAYEVNAIAATSTSTATQLDDVRVYNTTLTAAQVDALYTGTSFVPANSGDPAAAAAALVAAFPAPPPTTANGRVIGAWTFNEDPSTTNTAYDGSLYGHHLLLPPTAQLAATSPSVSASNPGSLRLFGTAGVRTWSSPFLPYVNLTRPETRRLWFRPANIESLQALVSYVGSNGDHSTLYIYSQRFYYFARVNGVEDRVITSRVLTAANTWYYVVLSRDVDDSGAWELSITLNAVEVARQPLSAVPTSLDSIHIGAINNDQVFQGHIDDITLLASYVNPGQPGATTSTATAAPTTTTTTTTAALDGSGSGSFTPLTTASPTSADPTTTATAATTTPTATTTTTTTTAPATPQSSTADVSRPSIRFDFEGEDEQQQQLAGDSSASGATVFSWGTGTRALHGVRSTTATSLNATVSVAGDVSLSLTGASGMRVPLTGSHDATTSSANAWPTPYETRSLWVLLPPADTGANPFIHSLVDFSHSSTFDRSGLRIYEGRVEFSEREQSTGVQTTVTAPPTTDLRTNTWRFVAMTRNASAIALYVDGELVAAGTTAAAVGGGGSGDVVPVPTDTLSIGYLAHGSAPLALTGAVDDVRVYRGVLNATDIQLLHQQGLARTLASAAFSVPTAPSPYPALAAVLAAGWAFEEGSGNVAFDASGSGYHALLAAANAWTSSDLVTRATVSTTAVAAAAADAADAALITVVRGAEDIMGAGVANYTLAASFRTTQASGVLMLVGGVGGDFDRVSLVIIDGVLVLSLTNAQSSAYLGQHPDDTPVTDGAWHTAVASFARAASGAYVVDLYLDGELLAWPSSPTVLSFRPVVEELFIGGRPDGSGGVHHDNNNKHNYIHNNNHYNKHKYNHHFHYHDDDGDNINDDDDKNHHHHDSCPHDDKHIHACIREW
ncbi:hypothetical protein PTSG_12948 [Salpingoeca rosetta]|uniref:Laminin G domain-containing protein n=1 Tax=Salpingoeca rosetta (strain ATCC 50818 / BSB-021) TaxID=946362 RepID=F2UNE5_SALR5|nr:uncharacterized protein PTSG_12948 [Salpingoeca rosetta]EGD79150.1 hypothetical protein PTSG_12948 [Salpingoeca rosetta]|eukprot:XP_004989235.1 hypothetical protein PTSG_12948 [Salpingoeca rosetta]